MDVTSDDYKDENKRCTTKNCISAWYNWYK